MYSPEQYTTDDWTKDEYTPLRNDDVIANYTKKVTDRNNYRGSVQEAMNLAAASVTVSPPSQDDSGIPEDLGNAPINTPDVQLGEQEEPLMARLYNAAPEWVQKAITPFLVPFTDNKVLRGITIGMGDGINGSLNLLRDINNAMHPDNQFTEEEWLQIPEIIERGDSTTEAIVGGLAQFMSVYGALGKLSSVNKLSGRAAKLWDDMWRAGIADAAFDPEDGNLATLINMLDEDKTVVGLPIGQLNGPFTQWLGTPVGEDAEAWERVEQRLKNLLEGAGLGLFAHGAVAGFKGLKQIMIESDPDKYFTMLKKAGFDVDPRQFLFENTLGAENIKTPELNELGMYSQLENAMINMTQDKNKPNDLLRYLTKNGVSNDELKNSGVLDLINEKKAAGESVTKDEVMEVFTDMDVTQSYQINTREYEGDTAIDNMTDEDELLEIYRAGGDASLSRYDNVNGKVLDHDDDQLYDYRGTGSVADDQQRIMKEFESGGYDGTDGIQLFEKLQELYPETYPKGMENNPDALDEFYLQLGSIKGGDNYQPSKHSNPDEFRQQVEEAAEKMAMDNYQADPTFQWELNEEFFRYKITGNETDGYRVEVHSQTIGGGQIDELDVAPNATEAMVRVQGYEQNFGSGSKQGGETRWSKIDGEWNIVHSDAVDTYKETVVTANSPSGTVFKGGSIHFPEDNKAYHLRTTEPNADTLYIEELQSDWAGDISKKGVKKGDNHIANLKAQIADLQKQDADIVLDDRLADTPEAKAQYQKDLDAATAKKNSIRKEIQKLDKELTDEINAVPQSPLPNDKWINVSLRHAIAMAIENGQTRVEWTPAQIHIDRWDEEYAKMYKILYDQKLGSIAKNIANTHKSTSGQHFIEINDAMIKHHKSGKGEKLMAAAPAIPAVQVANDKEDKS